MDAEQERYDREMAERIAGWREKLTAQKAQTVEAQAQDADQPSAPAPKLISNAFAKNEFAPTHLRNFRMTAPNVFMRKRAKA